MHFSYSRKETGSTQQEGLNCHLIVFYVLSPELSERDASAKTHEGLTILTVSKPLHQSFIQELVPVFPRCEITLRKLAVRRWEIIWVALYAPQGIVGMALANSEKLKLCKLSQPFIEPPQL